MNQRYQNFEISKDWQAETHGTLPPALGEIRIDSVKIIMPKRLVEVLNPDFGREIICIYKDTGEIAVTEKEFKNNAHLIEFKGIKTRFAVYKDKERKSEEVFVLYFNSKILGSKYFNGISKDNIRLVYEKLMALGEFRFSFDDFIHKSRCTDIDFKKDEIMPKFKPKIKKIEEAAIPHKERDKGLRSWKKGGNLGVEFGSRKQATETYPFLKLYHKGIELNSEKTLPFYAEFLSDQGYDLTDVVRVEFTMKDLAMMKRYGLAGGLTSEGFEKRNSLGEMLNLTQEELQAALSKVTNRHMSLDEIQRGDVVPRVGLMPAEIDLLCAMTLYLKHVGSVGMFKDYLEGLYSVAGKRRHFYRKPKQIDALYEETIRGTKTEEKAQSLERLWLFVGLTSPKYDNTEAA